MGISIFSFGFARVTEVRHIYMYTCIGDLQSVLDSVCCFHLHRYLGADVIVNEAIKGVNIKKAKMIPIVKESPNKNLWHLMLCSLFSNVSL